MRQQHIRHPSGTLAPCGNCGREPMHVVCHGTSTRENPTAIGGERHQLECNRCVRCTARHPTFGAAHAEWAVMFGRPPASPLRVVSRRAHTPQTRSIAQ